MASLLTLLRDLAWVARQSEHRQAIAERCQRLRLGIASQQFGSSERSALETLADQVDEALDR